MRFDDIAETTLRNRMDAVADNIMRDMTIGLYGESIPWRERGKLERVAIWLRIYRSRIRDAWLVLIGKAEIGGDY